MDKYQNYKHLFSKLNRALLNEFYLEAIFIEYAIIEDRAKSLLIRLERFDENKHNTISKKLTAINHVLDLKTCILSNYLTKDLIEKVRAWISVRNILIHALPNIEYRDEQVKEVALEGQRLSKIYSTKIGLHKKMYLRKTKIED